MGQNILNEDADIVLHEKKAEAYFKKYRPQMEALDSSPLAKFRSLTPNDYSVLGQQLDQFHSYANYMNEAGNAADLGVLPRIANDIITSGYGASIIPILSSVQPIEEERGTIYFKQVRVETTKGNMTSGTVLTDPRSPRLYQEEYAQEGPSYYSIAPTADGTTSYSGTLADSGLRKNSVRLEIPLTTGTLSGLDDGRGLICGVGFSGSIDYATGDWTIDFVSDPNEVKPINMTYGLDYESVGDNIPQITTFLDSTGIEAEIFALSSEVGMFKSWSMKKRFGMDAEDDLIADLTNEMISEVGTRLIRVLTAGVQASGLTWSQTPPNAISWRDHLITLKSQIMQAERQLLDQSGRGVINQMVAGPNACARLAELPGFVKSGIVLGGGPQIYGTLDGVNVIRATQVATNKIYLLYKGTTKFDTPLVYAPYMPLYVSRMENHGVTNPIKKHAVAAVWAGVKKVMSNFVTQIDITA